MKTIMPSVNRREFVKLMGLTGMVISIAPAGYGKGWLGGPADSDEFQQLAIGQLAGDFARAPDHARPWVYWFWYSGNVTKEGITADLEAMAKVGIGGVLIMEVNVGAPSGPVDFMSPQWREMFGFACSEAQRLGLKVNMNNDDGWCGSAGPWITPELSMQVVVWTELTIHGGSANITLPQPEGFLPSETTYGGPTPSKRGYYRDIAVFAFPTPPAEKAGRGYRLPDLHGLTVANEADWNPGKGAKGNIPTRARWPDILADQLVPSAGIIELTDKMNENGVLKYELPAGDWTVLRVGHASTAVRNHPATKDGLGLESDKLSKQATTVQFESFIGKLTKEVGPLSGKTLVSTHIDSWESGVQNWTLTMRTDFQRLRGYDPMLFLPVITGYVVDSMEVSQRFLWDWRQTISDLLIENYVVTLRELAAKRGMGLSIEGYAGVPVIEMQYGGAATEPMSECWSWPAYGVAYAVSHMTSTGHVYGRRIIGQETCTANEEEKWQAHPGNIKDICDWTFCQGVNRLDFSEYSMQPWTNPHYAPGMSLGPLGMHYERTQTWWAMSRPWHEYVTRCQFLLRQGNFVSDILYMQPEGAPAGGLSTPGMGDPNSFPKYKNDACPADVVLNRLSVQDGRLVLPDGMNYLVLVLPDSPTMTPELLGRIKQLAAAGATVIGNVKPQASPSLVGYPDCDAKVRHMADELWGSGKLIADKTAEEVLAAQGVEPDFSAPAPIAFCHRQTPDADIYFLANRSPAPVATQGAFRVTDKAPEFWNPETGSVEPAAVFQQGAKTNRVAIDLDPYGSIFVVFRKVHTAFDPVESLTHDGTDLFAFARGMAEQHGRVVEKATYGPKDDPAHTKDVTAVVQRLLRDGRPALSGADIAGLAGDPAPGVVKTLRMEVSMAGWHATFSADDDKSISFYPNWIAETPIRAWGSAQLPKMVIEKATYGPMGDLGRAEDVTAIVQDLVRGGRLQFPVTEIARIGGDPAPGVVKTLRVEASLAGWHSSFSAHDGELFFFAAGAPMPAALPPKVISSPSGTILRTGSNGRIGVKFASGKTRSVQTGAWPVPMAIEGPWKLTFPAGWGAPPEVELPKLISWSQHSDAGVRYFSGTARYHHAFALPLAPAVSRGQRLRYLLDLGGVAVMAQVTVNDRDMGIRWKAPFVLDVTDALTPGSNSLEVAVTNLWVNRLIGDQQLPQDWDRKTGAAGEILAWPQWLLEGKSRPSGRLAFTILELWRQNDPLSISGLLGPVRVLTLLDTPL